LERRHIDQVEAPTAEVINAASSSDPEKKTNERQGWIDSVPNPPELKEGLLGEIVCLILGNKAAHVGPNRWSMGSVCSIKDRSITVVKITSRYLNWRSSE
jgi:hypothetical protein